MSVENLLPFYTHGPTRIFKEHMRARSAKSAELYTLNALNKTIADCRSAANTMPSYPVIRSLLAHPVQYACMEVADFRATFRKLAPEVHEIFGVPGCVVAGGFVSKILLGDTTRECDIDVFIYADSLQEHQDRVDQVIKILNGINSCSIDVHTGIIYVHMNIEKIQIEIQIILRVYPSCASIIYGFDIPSSMVAYDGHQVYFTYVAVYAYAYMINIIWPALASTTYGRRISKYFDYGFNVGLPNLSMLEVGIMNLSCIRLCITSINGNVGFGRVMAHDAGSDTSDYAVSSKFAEIIRQIRYRSSTGKKIVKMLSCKPGYFKYAVGDTGRKLSAVLPTTKYELYYESVDHLVEDINEIFDNSPVEPWYFILCNISEGKFARVVENYRKVCGAAGIWDIEIPELRVRAVMHVVKFFNSLPEELNWWIVDNPASQTFGSLKPLVVNPIDWYTPRYYSETCVEFSLFLRPPVLPKDGKLLCGHIGYSDCNDCHVYTRGVPKTVLSSVLFTVESLSAADFNVANLIATNT